MTNYSTEKIETIESYIENPTADFYNDVFDGRYDIVMVVDWREEDDEIVQYCEKDVLTLANVFLRMRQEDLLKRLD